MHLITGNYKNTKHIYVNKNKLTTAYNQLRYPKTQQSTYIK